MRSRTGALRELRRHHFRFVVAAVLVGLLNAVPSFAYHTKEDPPILLTGHVLPQWRMQIGVPTLSVGLGKRLSLNTTVAGWALPLITGDFAPNATVRLGALKLDPVFIAFETGVIGFWPGDSTIAKVNKALGTEWNGNLVMVPLSLLASYHPNDQFLISTDGIYFFRTLRGANQVGSESGMVVGESFQMGITSQYALTRVIALTLRGRFVPWAPELPFSSSIELEGGGSLELNGKVELSSIKNSYQVIAGVAFSWSWLNIGVGVGYGNLFIPELGLVSGYRGVIPDANLSARF